MTSTECYCGSNRQFQDCCKPIIKGLQKATSAEALMRSRYAAYTTHQADYLVATTHISQRKHHTKADILDWATTNKWLQLEIINTTESTVEFKAYFSDNTLQNHIHHELSTFIFENGSWFYVDGKFF